MSVYLFKLKYNMQTIAPLFDLHVFDLKHPSPDEMMEHKNYICGH